MNDPVHAALSDAADLLATLVQETMAQGYLIRRQQIRRKIADVQSLLDLARSEMDRAARPRREPVDGSVR